MRKVENEPHYMTNVRNERFVLKEGVLVRTCIADLHYRVEYFEDCYDKYGNPLGEKLMKTEIKTKDKQVKESNHNISIIHIGFQFRPVTLGYCWRQEDVIDLHNLLVRTFGVKKIINDNSYTYNSGFRVGYKESYENAKFPNEIVHMGNTFMIHNENPTVISLKQYKENYKLALKLYPDNVKEIKYLYDLNIENVKKAQKYLEKSK